MICNATVTLYVGHPKEYTYVYGIVFFVNVFDLASKFSGVPINTSEQSMMHFA